MTHTAPGEAERLPLRTKLAFGIGSAAESIALYSVSAFGLLFYNQVLGVPAHLAGLAISASLFLDALSDPIVGSWSDRTRSKLGRRHPYMYAAPIPIALSVYAIFNPPVGMDQTGLLIWFAVSVIMLRQAMTFFHTPHLALGAELSTHYIERSKVMAYNSFFAWAGAAFTTTLALRIFFPSTPEFPRGVLNPEPWSVFAMSLAIATLLILFASAWFTRDRIPFLPPPAKDETGFSPAAFIKDVGRALTNINYVWLLVAYFFLALMLGLRESLRMYTNTFYWGLNSEQLSLFIIGSFLGYAAAFVIAPRLHGRTDKRRTIIVACLIYALVPPIPLVLGLMGVLGPGDPFLLPILIAFAGIGYLTVSILQISVMSALADIADENELKHGVRQEGVLYSTRALAAKLDQAIGAALGGFVITAIQFPIKATPGEVAPTVLNKLAFADGVLAAIPGLIAVGFYAQYRINRAKFDETRAALNARKAAAAPALAE
ncbi:MFS transporter [Phenylobacterium sp.]|uniref:MFS transporter n=1 Tax=Phenylobacterium sp. TaxID=1871053 RepID=UPI003D2865F4